MARSSALKFPLTALFCCARANSCEWPGGCVIYCPRMRNVIGIFGFVVLNCISIADAQNYSIQTIAGRTLVTEGGAAVNSFLRNPTAVAKDSLGNTYIADQNDNRVWKVDPNGMITTFAGTGFPDYTGDGGPANKAALNSPSNLAVDSNNNIYICDS